MSLFKSIIGAIALLGCAHASVYAQSATSLPSEYKLTIKSTDLDKLGKALGTLPFNDVADLMASLRQQIIEQQQMLVSPPKAEGGNKEEKK